MKIKTLLIISGMCWLTLAAIAQDFEDENEFLELSSDTSFDDESLIPGILDESVNSLLESWHTKYFAKSIDYCIDDTENIILPDEVYSNRLSKMPCIIPMDYNHLVRTYIDLYAKRRRDLVRYMMGMADLYFPIFEQILDQYGLPLELKHLALVESALNPVALSRVGAAGLWQFMLPTGKAYNLEINSLIDERLDPVKATHAMCKYFKDMYAVYGDWHLAIAAYNCGPGGVNRAIRRSGGKTNFWEIYPNLPRETRSFVPRFIAATYIMNYHCEHNLCPMQISLSMATDTIVVNQMLHFQQIADILNLDIEHIRLLNPQYKREIIPGNIKPAILNLPVASTYDFIDREDTLYKHRLEELLAYCIPVESEEEMRETIKHTAVAGENLTVIANRYGVTAANLRQWNGLKSNTVAAGRQITVRVNNGGIRFAAVPEPAPTSKATASSTTATKSNVSGATSAQRNDMGMISYKVQSGDTLFSIAKKYPGVTVAKIQSANQMTGDKLRIGQVLMIPVG